MSPLNSNITNVLGMAYILNDCGQNISMSNAWLLYSFAKMPSGFLRNGLLTIELKCCHWVVCVLRLSWLNSSTFSILLSWEWERHKKTSKDHDFVTWKQICRTQQNWRVALRFKLSWLVSLDLLRVTAYFFICCQRYEPRMSIAFHLLFTAHQRRLQPINGCLVMVN